MSRIPVWEQADVGICFAETAVDLLNADRDCHAPVRGAARDKDFISPMAAAIMACKGQNCQKPPRRDRNGSLNYPFEGGYVCDVINYLRVHPACTRQDFAKAFGPDTKASLEKVAEQYDVYQRVLHDPLTSADPRFSASTFAAENAVCRLNQQGFNLPIEDSVKALQKVMGGTLLEYFQYLTTEACPAEKAVPIDAPECMEVDTSNPKVFLKALHEHFDQALDHALPMDVSYCSDLFEKGKKYSGIIPNNGKKPLVRGNLCKGYDPDDPEDDGGHSSVLIGRRFNSRTHKCQLLIKNSWGADKNEDFSKDWKDEGGKIWIDEDTLARNLQEYSVLKESR